MTHTGTDDDIDAALADLGSTLDRGAHDEASLAAVRRRLVGRDTERGEPQEPDVADVVSLGAPPDRRASTRRRWVAAGLVAAAVVVGATAVAVTRWDGSGPDPTPAATPVAGDPDALERDLALVPRPLPDAGDNVVLFETSGRGDALFGDAFAVPDASATLALTYSFVCARPATDTAASSGPFSVDDDAGTTGELASCPTVGTGVPPVGTASPPTAVGRTGIRVSTPDPDVVWRLVVSLAPR